MAQADQTVQNNTFPTVRADINNNLAALFSKNSGATAPSTTVAYMDWIDTSGANPVWKKRNAANNAWITLGTIVSNTIAFEGTLPSQSGNSGKYLTTDGTNASWAAVTSGGQLLRAPQILTSGTSYTTPADCTKIYVECVGGGGGGRDAVNVGGSFRSGGGGGGGAYCAKYFTVTASTSYTYAIGAGGAANSAGGNTTFAVGGTTITAGGGSAGNGGAAPVYGATGGTATNGDLNVKGNDSEAKYSDIAGSTGASSFFGGAARGGVLIGGIGAGGAAGSSGGGGGGASGGGGAGGAGGAGLIRIWEYS